MTLEKSLQQVAAMVDRVLSYVRSVLTGEVDGDIAVGRYLMDTLSATTAGIEKGKLEGLFNAHLQVLFLFAVKACILTAASGHAYDFVPGESGAVASGSLVASGVGDLNNS